MFQKSISACASLGLLCLFIPCQAKEPLPTTVPDLTQGGKLTRINERWVGPVGIHCGFWRPKGETKMEDVRQLQVLEVQKGSPADGVLEVDDVILGADGTGATKVSLFEGSKIWPMIAIGNAITEAEARNPAILNLLVWRKGETKTVPIKLEYLGRYSDTAPYNCEKSKAILRKGIQALYEKNQPDKAGFSVLCLLAADDPTNPENAKYQARAKEWVHLLEPEGSPWYVGPKLMAMSEYYMKTKDETILPKLEALAEYHAKGVSWFGTCGHRYSELTPEGTENGRIAGYGPITASGTLGYLGLSLARKAGVENPAVEKSHKAQKIFFGHYAFKSGMGYGEHAYGLGGCTDDYNGKQATSGLAVGMDEDGEKNAKYFSKVAALSSMDVRQYAHGGSFFGQVFHPLGAAQGGEKAANMQFKEIRWHLDLKRSWDHSRIYDASGNGYNDFEKGATALIFYAAPLKQIYLTGRGQKDSLKFTDADFKELQEIKNFDASQATVDELIDLLGRYDGMLRGGAATELANRLKAEPDSPEAPALIDRLLAISADGKQSTYARAGACFALMLSKDRSPDVIKLMKNEEIAQTMAALLSDPVAYIRFAGVRVLQALDPAAVKPHANAIMDAIVATGRPTFPLDEEDPLQWAHGEMGDLLARHVFKDNVDGADRKKLIPALRSLLQTPSGRARSLSTKMLAHLSKEEALEVADLVVDNIHVSPPADAMFSWEASGNSQKVLAKHLFKEALPLIATHYHSKSAVGNELIQNYGKAALEMRSARQLVHTVGEQLLIETVDLRSMLEGLQKGNSPGELNTMMRIDEVKAEQAVLKLPAASTRLTAEATNFGRRGENDTTYTWRKLYGAGEVKFTPNASSASKATTVTFTDKKAGKYGFEIEMSDTLSLAVERKVVHVDLVGANGKIPSNKPPQAKPQSFEVIPGQPLTFTPSGTDPDGDALGFVIKQQPEHGSLTDIHGRIIDNMAAIDAPLVYTANYGFNGSDQVVFIAMDGQGKTSESTIAFKASDKDVGVAIYEPFNYPAGPLGGQQSETSFGFAAPWVSIKGGAGKYKVETSPLQKTKTASLHYTSLPALGGRLLGERHERFSRLLDPAVLSKHNLLDDGGELWFSIMLEQPNVSFALQGGGTSIGFGSDESKRTLFAILNGKEAGESNNPWSRSLDLRFKNTAPHMIVGRFTWGKGAEDLDKLEIFRVFDAPIYGPMLLEKPICVLEQTLDQKVLNEISLSVDSGKVVDEIRLGSTLSSVMIGTKPLK